MQLILMKKKNSEILTELGSSLDDYKLLEEKNNLQIELLEQLTGSITSLNKLDLNQIVELEKQLRMSLQSVEERKVSQSLFSIFC